MNCCDPSKQVCPPPACDPLPPPPGRVTDFAPAQGGVDAMDATLEFKHAQANGASVASYEIRYREGESMNDDEFLQAIRAPLVPPGAPGTVATFTLSGLKPAMHTSPGCARRTSAGRPPPSSCSRSRRRRGSSSRWRGVSSPPPPGLADGGQRAGAARAARPPAGGQRGRGGGHRPLLSVGARGGRRHPQGPRGAGPGPPAAGPNRGAGARRPSRYNARRCRGTCFCSWGRPWPRPSPVRWKGVRSRRVPSP